LFLLEEDASSRVDCPWNLEAVLAAGRSAPAPIAVIDE
jgi:hypothetical protein